MSTGETWELQDEAVLACAVERYRPDWDSILKEVQRKCPHLRKGLTTACQCRLKCKYEELIRRFKNLNPGTEGVSSVHHMAIRDGFVHLMTKLREEGRFRGLLDDKLVQFARRVDDVGSDVWQFTQIIVSTAWRSIQSECKLDHNSMAGKENEMKWDSLDESILAYAVLDHKAVDWDWESIASQVQKKSSLPRQLTTADKCRLMFEKVICPRYGGDNEDFLVIFGEHRRRQVRWPSEDEFLLACALIWHHMDWDVISTEIRKRSKLPNDHTTPLNCMFKYHHLVWTYGGCDIFKAVPRQDFSALKDLVPSDLAYSFFSHLAPDLPAACDQKPSRQYEVAYLADNEVAVLMKERVHMCEKTIGELKTTLWEMTVQLIDMIKVFKANSPIAVPIPKRNRKVIKLDEGFTVTMDKMRYQKLEGKAATLVPNSGGCYSTDRDHENKSSLDNGGCSSTDMVDDKDFLTAEEDYLSVTSNEDFLSVTSDEELFKWLEDFVLWEEDDDTEYIVFRDHSLLPFEDTVEKLKKRCSDLMSQLTSQKVEMETLVAAFASPTPVTGSCQNDDGIGLMVDQMKDLQFISQSPSLVQLSSSRPEEVVGPISDTMRHPEIKEANDIILQSSSQVQLSSSLPEEVDSPISEIEKANHDTSQSSSQAQLSSSEEVVSLISENEGHVISQPLSQGKLKGKKRKGGKRQKKPSHRWLRKFRLGCIG